MFHRLSHFHAEASSLPCHITKLEQIYFLTSSTRHVHHESYNTCSSSTDLHWPLCTAEVNIITAILVFNKTSSTKNKSRKSRTLTETELTLKKEPNWKWKRSEVKNINQQNLKEWRCCRKAVNRRQEQEREGKKRKYKAVKNQVNTMEREETSGSQLE